MRRNGQLISFLEQNAKEGDSPVLSCLAVAKESKSRLVWDCWPNWEINFF